VFSCSNSSLLLTPLPSVSNHGSTQPSKIPLTRGAFRLKGRKPGGWRSGETREEEKVLSMRCQISGFQHFHRQLIAKNGHGFESLLVFILTEDVMLQGLKLH